MLRTIYPNKAMLPAELQPGDTVTLEHYEGNGKRTMPFDAALVEKVDDRFVWLFRPYATHTYTIYGSDPQVISLIGIEKYGIERSHPSLRYFVWSRLAPEED